MPVLIIEFTLKKGLFVRVWGRFWELFIITYYYEWRKLIGKNQK